MLFCIIKKILIKELIINIILFQYECEVKLKIIIIILLENLIKKLCKTIKIMYSLNICNNCE